MSGNEDPFLSNYKNKISSFGQRIRLMPRYDSNTDTIRFCSEEDDYKSRNDQVFLSRLANANHYKWLNENKTCETEKNPTFQTSLT